MSISFIQRCSLTSWLEAHQQMLQRFDVHRYAASHA
jgi:hypothetical protein